MVISHPCGSVAQMKEEKFWHCAHRLHNMLADGAVLPGGGATEQACAAMLQSGKSEFSIQIDPYDIACGHQMEFHRTFGRNLGCARRERFWVEMTTEHVAFVFTVRYSRYEQPINDCPRPR